MKKVLLCALSLVSVVACTSATEPEESEEVVESESSALISYGYCDVSAAGTLTGKCRGGQSMCCAKTVTTCPLGATAGQAVRYPGIMCGPISYDNTRRCQQYCNL